MPNATVSDTSCLILFYKIGEFHLLHKIFGKIFITETVLKEFNKAIPEWIEVANPKSELDKGLLHVLDAGEATSIALANELKDSLLIIDEAKGRNVAKDIGLEITGSLGVLVTAKRKGYIKAVKPLIEKVEKTNFRISKRLIAAVLERVDES